MYVYRLVHYLRGKKEVEGASDVGREWSDVWTVNGGTLGANAETERSVLHRRLARFFQARSASAVRHDVELLPQALHSKNLWQRPKTDTYQKYLYFRIFDFFLFSFHFFICCIFFHLSHFEQKKKKINDIIILKEKNKTYETKNKTWYLVLLYME